MGPETQPEGFWGRATTSMPVLISFLVGVSLAVIWAAAAAVLFQMAHWPALTCALLGGVGFLASMNLYAAIQRLRERKAVEADLNRLAEANERMSKDLQESNRRMAEVADAIEAKVLDRSQKLVGEVKVLEALIRDFADGIGERVRTLETGGDARGLQARLDGEAQKGRLGLRGKSYVEDLADPDLLTAIRRSLVENRVDLYLQPIVSLPQRRLRYYEAFTRLRMPDGNLIMPAQYLRVAEPAGLMSAIDNLLLFRCIQVIRRLTRGARDISIFCNISAHSLADRTFFPQFLEFMAGNRDLSGHIVFEFAADTVAHLTEAEDANLRYLADLGFTFSLDKLSTLDVDFDGLRERRFRFLKAPVSLLLEHDANSRGIVASDLKDLLARHGMSLIAEKIEEERHVVDILDFNVDFGQGYLFGEPKPIRDTMLESGTPKPLVRAAG